MINLINIPTQELTMKRKKFLTALFTSAGLSLAVISCGGGGGGGSSSTATVQTKTYLAYKASIHLVDPDTLNSTQISDKPILDTASLMVVNSFNVNTRQYSDLHVDSIYWIEEADNNTGQTNGGPIKGISVVKTDQQPQAKQISNTDSACYFLNTYEDYVNRIFYSVVQTAGADGECNTQDDKSVFISSLMGSNDTAIDLDGKNIITDIDKGTGITGFVVWNNTEGTLYKCDTNLSNCSQLMDNVLSVSDFVSNPKTFDEYLCINNELYLFDGNQLTDRNVSCGNYDNTEADGNAIYARNANNETIEKLDHSGTDGWLTIYDGGDVQWIAGITQNYVVFVTDNGTLKAVKKDGSETLEIENQGTITDAYIQSTKAFYNKETNNTSYACVWDEENNDVSCEENAQWIGFSLAPFGTLLEDDENAIPVYKMLKESGSTIYSVDPAQTTDKLKLGQLPPNYVYPYAFGIGNNLLLVALDELNGEQSDIFFIDVSEENSLKQLTNSTDKNEWPIW